MTTRNYPCIDPIASEQYVGLDHCTDCARPLHPGDDFLGIAATDSDGDTVAVHESGILTVNRSSVDLHHLATHNAKVYAGGPDSLTFVNNGSIFGLVKSHDQNSISIEFCCSATAPKTQFQSDNPKGQSMTVRPRQSSISRPVATRPAAAQRPSVNRPAASRTREEIARGGFAIAIQSIRRTDPKAADSFASMIANETTGVLSTWPKELQVNAYLLELNQAMNPAHVILHGPAGCPGDASTDSQIAHIEWRADDMARECWKKSERYTAYRVAELARARAKFHERTIVSKPKSLSRDVALSVAKSEWTANKDNINQTWDRNAFIAYRAKQLRRDDD